MSFKLENFVAAPSMELLNLAKKTDLLNIADHYALTSVNCLVGWLFWIYRPFETVFQSISGRLPERERERKEK